MRKVILLFFSLATMLNAQELYAQAFSVRGKVVSSDGNEPLIGASIQQEGSGSGVITTLMVITASKSREPTKLP